MVDREQSLELVRNYAYNYGLLRKFVCDLAGKYRECYDGLEAIKNQHYHINVIEELHINENGHSRILCKLLQYRATNGKYVFLESLLGAIGRIEPAFSRIEIRKPIITQEKGRIDLWIRDYESGYAVIFENKVYNANDRDAQIYRYIKETEKEGFTKGCIFIYMPETERDPDKRTWGDEKEEYEKTFAERYVCFPFKEQISKWVKDILESKIVEWENETILHSALLQYSHFLDTLYNKQESNMLQSLERVIEDALSPDFNKIEPMEEKIKILSDYMYALESMDSENDETLAEKIDKNKAVLKSLVSRLNALLDRYILVFCKTSSVQIKNERPDVNVQIIEDGYITLALPPFKGVSNDLTLSIKAERSNTYIQLTSKSGKLQEISAFDELKRSKYFTDSNEWNYWKVVDFSPSNIEIVIKDYKMILDRILDTEYWKA